MVENKCGNLEWVRWDVDGMADRDFEVATNIERYDWVFGEEQARSMEGWSGGGGGAVPGGVPEQDLAHVAEFAYMCVACALLLAASVWMKRRRGRGAKSSGRRDLNV
jgi:hypothetical protein